MATLAALRKEAKAAGIPAKAIRLAGSAAELSALIASNGKPRKASAVKAVKAAKKSVVKKATVKSAAKKAPAAKSTKGKAKRPSTTRPKAGDTGRALIGDVDFNATGEWEPRKGSAPDRIIRALKKVRGNRDKAFDLLVPDLWDFMGKVKRNGQKRTKAEAHAMLKYRIARTLWDFCLKTNQHDKATNRIEYGTGPNAKPKSKRAKKAAVTTPKKRGRPKGSTTKATTGKRRGRPPGSKNVPKAKATAKATTGKRRGRPPGSKNKPK
jgi:hypothetical protein